MLFKLFFSIENVLKRFFPKTHHRDFVIPFFSDLPKFRPFPDFWHNVEADEMSETPVVVASSHIMVVTDPDFGRPLKEKSKCVWRHNETGWTSLESSTGNLKSSFNCWLWTGVFLRVWVHLRGRAFVSLAAINGKTYWHYDNTCLT